MKSVNIFCVQTGGKSRIACLCVERHTVNSASASKSGEMFIPPASKGGNVHTARFNGRNVRATWRRCDSCEYRPRYARAGTLRARHNRHHAALGTQSTIIYFLHSKLFQYFIIPLRNLNIHHFGTIQTPRKYFLAFLEYAFTIL